MKRLENIWVYVHALATAVGALAAATEGSRRNDAALTLVGAIGRSEERMFATSFGEELLQLVRQDRQSRLLALEADARRSLVSDRVRSVILEGEGFFMGITAEEIIAHLPRSVVVVKPPGFVSPVRPSRREHAKNMSPLG